MATWSPRCCAKNEGGLLRRRPLGQLLLLRLFGDAARPGAAKALTLEEMRAKPREDPDFMAVPTILQEKLAEYNARPALREGSKEPQCRHFEMV